MKNTFRKLMQEMGCNYSRLTKNECFLAINDSYDIEFYPEKSLLFNVVIRLVLWHHDKKGAYYPIKKEAVNGYDIQQLLIAKDNLTDYCKSIV